MAKEGSSVTLLGLVNYEPKTDTFAMKEVASVIGGGLRAAINRLTEQLGLLQKMTNFFLFSGLAFLSTTALRYYAYWLQERARLARIKA